MRLQLLHPLQQRGFPPLPGSLRGGVAGGRPLYRNLDCRGRLLLRLLLLQTIHEHIIT